MVTGPAGERSGYQSYAFCASGRTISGVTSVGASITPGLAAMCGCFVLPSLMTTVTPLVVVLKSNFEKSNGMRIQPWLAGYPGKLPECMAMPVHVSRCMLGMGALSYF